MQEINWLSTTKLLHFESNITIFLVLIEFVNFFEIVILANVLPRIDCWSSVHYLTFTSQVKVLG